MSTTDGKRKLAAYLHDPPGGRPEVLEDLSNMPLSYNRVEQPKKDRTVAFKN